MVQRGLLEKRIQGRKKMNVWRNMGLNVTTYCAQAFGQEIASCIPLAWLCEQARTDTRKWNIGGEGGSP